MTEPTDQRRDDLLASYRSAFDSWQEAVDGLEAGDWEAPTGCPGWDVHDQLAHVVSVERVILGDDEPPQTELPPDLAYVRHDFGRFVERGVQARRGMPPERLVAEAAETFARRSEQLAALPPSYLDEEVDPPVPVPKMRGAQLMRTRIFDVTTHQFDVRRAVDRLDEPGGGHVAISQELILRAWSRALPHVIEGSAVLGIEVDGTELARIDVGDGTLHRGGEGPQTDAALAVTLAQLFAIAGGRTDAPQLGDVETRGDVTLVRAVLDADGITP